MAILVEWVEQTVSGTPGTGTITLSVATANRIRLQDDTRITDGQEVYCTITDGDDLERGIYTYNSAGATLSRTDIHAKMDGGTYTENPGTILSLTTNAIVRCTAIAKNFNGAVVTTTSNFSLTTGVPGIVPFASESYDYGGFHDNSTNNTRLTVPVGISKVILKASMRFQTNATNHRAVTIILNGVDLPVRPVIGTSASPTGETTVQVVSHVVPVISSDYFEVKCYQDSGISLNIETNISTWFSIEVVE